MFGCSTFIKIVTSVFKLATLMSILFFSIIFTATGFLSFLVPSLTELKDPM